MDNIQTLDLSEWKSIITYGRVRMSIDKQHINIQNPVNIIFPTDKYKIMMHTFKDVKKINNIVNFEYCEYVHPRSFYECELSEELSKLIQDKLEIKENPTQQTIEKIEQKPIVTNIVKPELPAPPTTNPVINGVWILYYGDIVISKLSNKISEYKWEYKNNTIEYVDNEWLLIYNNNTFKNNSKSITDKEIDFGGYKCVLN